MEGPRRRRGPRRGRSPPGATQARLRGTGPLARRGQQARGRQVRRPRLLRESLSRARRRARSQAKCRSVACGDARRHPFRHQTDTAQQGLCRDRGGGPRGRTGHQHRHFCLGRPAPAPAAAVRFSRRHCHSLGGATTPRPEQERGGSRQLRRLVRGDALVRAAGRIHHHCHKSHG